MEKINIETFKLSSGAHDSIDKGACLLELASHMANEPFSDRPQCVCPALAAFGRLINDRMDDDNRQKLKACLPRMLNTRDDKTLQRAKVLSHSALTVFAPIALDSCNLPESAAKMRSLPFGDWKANGEVARKSSCAAYAASDAASASSAASYAARSAAKSKVWDAVLEVFEQALSV